MSPLSGWGAKNGKRMIGDFWPIFKLVSAITDVFERFTIHGFKVHGSGPSFPCSRFRSGCMLELSRRA
jgi:hypothetical protein